MPDAIYPALHGRQHCPGGEDPIPCLTSSYPYMYRELTADSLALPNVPASSAGISIEFDYTSDAADAQGFFQQNISDPTQVTDILSQGTDSRGVYQFTAGARWENDFDADANLIIVCNSFGWGVSSTYRAPWDGGPSRGDMAMSLDFRARLFTGASTSFELQVCHNDPADQTILSAFVEVAYLGPFTGGDSNHLPFGFWT